MKINKKTVTDLLLTVIMILLTFGVNLLIQAVFDTQTLIPMIFVLGIFLISLRTDGYIFGIASSLVCVLLVNFAFTFPYYGFDLLSPIPLFSAVVMLIVSVLTCTVTKRVREIEKLRAEKEREQMRANLLRAVSHDLRTPLTTIYGSSSAILENLDQLSDEQLKKHLEAIKQDSEWLIRMVENLLSVTRIDGGNVKLTMCNTVLEELVDSVLTSFAKRYPEFPIELNIPDEFISIPMDAILIEQVLINLLENAVFHAKGMTVLSLNITATDLHVRFEVADNGCGIPDDKIGTLFNGGNSHTNRSSDSSRINMGIGLSVCSTIIKAHASNIIAENRKGGGASFSFVLEREVTDGEQQ